MPNADAAGTACRLCHATRLDVSSGPWRAAARLGHRNGRCIVAPQRPMWFHDPPVCCWPGRGQLAAADRHDGSRPARHCRRSRGQAIGNRSSACRVRWDGHSRSGPASSWSRALRSPSPKTPHGRSPTAGPGRSSNLDVTGVTSFCYADDEANCRRYGRLYTWDDGWPGMPDARRRLETADRCGVDEAGAALRRRAWRRRPARRGGIRGPDEGRAIGLRCGSRRRPRRRRRRTRAATRTASTGRPPNAAPATAVFYNFGKGSRGLYRQNEGEKERAFAVRCVKD